MNDEAKPEQTEAEAKDQEVLFRGFVTLIVGMTMQQKGVVHGQAAQIKISSGPRTEPIVVSLAMDSGAPRLLASGRSLAG